MLRNFFVHIGYWALLGIILGILRFVGLDENPSIQILTDDSVLVYAELGFWFALIGTVSFLADVLVERRKHSLTYGRSILVKSGILFIGTLFIFVVVLIFEDVILDVATKVEDKRYVLYVLREKTFYIALMYVFLGSVLFYTGTIVNKKFGRGMLLKILLGVYRKPKEENRIFMFMDLRSSTTLAEKLGNWDFSSLMQRTFLSINFAVRNSSAEIYQYLGDGILLTWPTSDKTIAESLNLHFEVTRVIDSEKAEYEEKFGVVPEFKTGIHFGNVTASEIGDIRKEVSYHGDVINTAARLEGYCNTLDSEMVVSDEMAKRIRELKLPYEMTMHEDVELRGKEELQRVWTVSEL